MFDMMNNSERRNSKLQKLKLQIVALLVLLSIAVNITANQNGGLTAEASALNSEGKKPSIEKVANKTVTKAATSAKNMEAKKEIVPLVSIEVPEGLKIEHLGLWFEEQGYGTKNELMQLANDKQFYQKLSAKYSVLPKEPKQVRYLLEGYLLGGGIKVPSNKQNLESIVEGMVKEMDSFVTELSIQSNLNRSIQEVISIASIVEKESNHPSERKKIASVFLNRLDRDMKLQSCVTAMYAVNIDTAPTKEDVRTPSPYNTYLEKGTPVGPINNPSRDSLTSTFFPEEVKYLFFVGDGTRTYFAVNYQQHLDNIDKYL